MPAQSLYELAKQQLIRNINMLDDIGDMPYAFLAPILRHIQNPQQLMELEERCPQILGETEEIWMRYIKRDIPKWAEKPHRPNNPENWSKVYKKLKRDAEREKAEQEEALKEQMRALQQGREKNKTLIVEGKTGYDPANRRWGFGSRGPSVTKGSGSWGDPAAPRKTGKIVLDKLRRGVYDSKTARPKASMMPAHILEQRRGVLKEAPARMVRMAENEGPKSMVISKQASASVAGRTAIPHPTLRKVPISQVQASGTVARPSSSSTPEKRVERPTLGGQTFAAPRLNATSPDAPRPIKRRQPAAPSLFHNTKRLKR